MKRIYFLDGLRILSMIAIVVLHVAGSYWYNLDVTTYSWQVINAYDCITRWGVPVFVMISGALFLDPARPQSIKKIWSKNILHIVILILFWGLIYALLYNFPRDFSQDSVFNFLKEFIFGPQHLWFLFMLIGLYILVPPLRCITQNKTVLQYFLVIGFVANVALPLLTVGGNISIVKELFDKLLIQMPIGYSFYFVLGYYLYAFPLKKGWRITLYILGIAGLVASVITTSLASLNQGAPDNTFIMSSYFFMFASAALFVLFRQCFSKHPLKERTKKLIMIGSSCSLGVYILHIFVLRTLMKLGLSATAFDPLFAVPILALLTFVIAFILTYGLKKIPFVNKYLI